MQQFLELSFGHKFSKIEDWISEAQVAATEQLKSLSAFLPETPPLTIIEINNLITNYSNQVLQMRFIQYRCQQCFHENGISHSEKQVIAKIEKSSVCLERISEKIILILYDFSKNQLCIKNKSC